MFLLVCLTVYVVYFRSAKKPGTSQQNKLATTSTLPIVASSTPFDTLETNSQNQNGKNSTSTKFGYVMDTPPLAAYFVSPTSTIWYIESSGKVSSFYKGKKTELSSSEISGLRRAVFSPDGKEILVSFVSNGSIKLSVYQIENNSWLPLPEPAKAADWGPDTKTHQLFLVSENGGNTYLGTLDVDNPNAKVDVLVQMKSFGFIPSWVSSSTVVLSEAPSARAPASLWKLNIKNKTLSPILQDIPGLSAIWNMNSTGGLIFETNNQKYGGILIYADYNSLESRDLKYLTLPEKCVFADPTNKGVLNSVICAVPKDQDSLNQQILPDDYLTKNTYTEDQIYSIDLDGGQISNLLLPANVSIDATQLSLENSILFFINRYDQRLYALKLSN